MSVWSTFIFAENRILWKIVLYIYLKKVLRAFVNQKTQVSLYLWSGFIAPFLIIFNSIHNYPFLFNFLEIFIFFASILLLFVFLLFRKTLIPFGSLFFEAFLCFLITSGWRILDIFIYEKKKFIWNVVC